MYERTNAAWNGLFVVLVLCRHQWNHILVWTRCGVEHGAYSQSVRFVHLTVVETY